MIRTQAQGRCGAAELCATCRIATTAFVELANLVDQHLSGVEPDQWAIIIRQWTQPRFLSRHPLLRSWFYPVRDLRKLARGWVASVAEYLT
jgi:hypothetical protein